MSGVSLTHLTVKPSLAVGTTTLSVSGMLRRESLKGHSQGIRAVFGVSRMRRMAVSSLAEAMTTLCCSGILPKPFEKINRPIAKLTMMCTPNELSRNVFFNNEKN